MAIAWAAGSCRLGCGDDPTSACRARAPARDHELRRGEERPRRPLGRADSADRVGPARITPEGMPAVPAGRGTPARAGGGRPPAGRAVRAGAGPRAPHRSPRQGRREVGAGPRSSRRGRPDGTAAPGSRGRGRRGQGRLPRHLSLRPAGDSREAVGADGGDTAGACAHGVRATGNERTSAACPFPDTFFVRTPTRPAGGRGHRIRATGAREARARGARTCAPRVLSARRTGAAGILSAGTGRREAEGRPATARLARGSLSHCDTVPAGCVRTLSIRRARVIRRFGVR